MGRSGRSGYVVGEPGWAGPAQWLTRQAPGLSGPLRTTPQCTRRPGTTISRVYSSWTTGADRLKTQKTAWNGWLSYAISVIARM